MTSSTPPPEQSAPPLSASEPLSAPVSAPGPAPADNFIAGLALLLALLALAQPWAIERYARAHPAPALTQPAPILPIPQAPTAAIESAPEPPVPQAPAPPPPQATLAPDLAAKLADIQTNLALQQAALGQLRTNQQGAMDATTLRLFIASQQMRVAILLGHPFATQLAVIDKILPQKTGAPDPDRAAILDALSPFAATGLPTFESLAARYETLTPDLVRAMRAGRAKGPWGKIMAEAQNIFLVRRKEPAGADDSNPESGVAAISAALAAHDLAGARDLTGRLPAAAQPLIAAWKTDADHLFGAEQALGKLDTLIIADTGQTQL